VARYTVRAFHLLFVVSFILVTHSRFTAFFRDHPGELVPEDIFFWTFMVQGKMTEADTLTIVLMGTIPFRLISDPAPSLPPFLSQMPFLLQPSHFVLAFDRHQIQICAKYKYVLAYQVAWFGFILVSKYAYFKVQISKPSLYTG